jgi:hypothetical protein
MDEWLEELWKPMSNLDIVAAASRAFAKAILAAKSPYGNASFLLAVDHYAKRAGGLAAIGIDPVLYGQTKEKGIQSVVTYMLDVADSLVAAGRDARPELHVVEGEMKLISKDPASDVRFAGGYKKLLDLRQRSSSLAGKNWFRQAKEAKMRGWGAEDINSFLCYAQRDIDAAGGLQAVPEITPADWEAVAGIPYRPILLPRVAAVQKVVNG